MSQSSITVSADLLAAKEELAGRLLGPLPLVAAATSRLSRAISGASRNVHAVGIGRRIVAGKPTDEACVRLYVVQKLPTALLPPRDLLPEEVDGVPVDVIAAPRAYLLGTRRATRRSRGTSNRATVAAANIDPRSRQRPMMPGISIAHFDVTTGTLGAFCKKKGDASGTHVYVLSNNHVLANLNRALARDDVYQPGPLDNGTVNDAVADVDTFVPIALGASTSNRVDCALALLRSGVPFDPAIASIGPLGQQKTAQPSENLPVRKHGRTTGLTRGIIDDASYTTIVGLDHQDPSVVGRFRDQLRVIGGPDDPIVAGWGDSGALLVTDTSPASAVGLYFAGPEDGSYGLANPIDEVTSALGIELL
jgi:hypothetical protein